MSDKVRAWAWDLNLPPARKLILLWLAGRATDNGVAFPGEREIRDKTGLGERMVRYHLQGLTAGEANGQHSTSGPLLHRIERRVSADRNTSNVYILRVPWAEPAHVRRDVEELKHISESALTEVLARVGVGATGCPQVESIIGNALPPLGAMYCPQVGAPGYREESSRENRHPNTPPVPPAGVQQQGLTVRPTGTTSDPAVAGASKQTEPLKLAEAFYRGLGGDATAVTAAIRRRDLVIACDLVAAGATPSEAEAYARQTSTVSGRIAAVDLRSFERERLGWLALRRGGHQNGRVFVDRTGQPPSWQSDPPPATKFDVPEANCGSSAEIRLSPHTAGGQLGQVLRFRLMGGGAW